MTLYYPNQVRVGRGLELVLRDFLNAINETSTRGAIEKGLGVGRSELEIGDDVGLADLCLNQRDPGSSGFHQ